MIARCFCFFFVFCISGVACAQDNVVASAFSKPITLSSLSPSKDELKEFADMDGEAMINEPGFLTVYRENKLTEVLFDAALKQFANEKGIAPTEALISSFLDKFGPAMADKSDADKRAIAQKQVMRWQVDKALYETYGGTVVFQQSNPLSPIKAYHSLLTGYFERGEIVISHQAFEKAFWQAMSTDKYGLTVPESQVDFSAPWWEKTAG